jgi:DNA-binding response OmpR family regulator
MVNILTISENKELSRQMNAALRQWGYQVFQAEESEAALALLGHQSVQLIVADYESGGCDLTAELRQGGDATPVIILIPNNRMWDKRRVFRSGADGYMPLPLDMEELQMRIENLLWRCNIVSASVLKIGSCELHSGTFQLITPEETIDLRRMEFLLLQKLLSYPGRIFTRPQLMDELWGYDSESEPRTVDTHVKLLRRKLKNVEDIRIQTVRGLGYRAAIPKKGR